MKNIEDLDKFLKNFKINLEEQVFEATEETTFQLKKDVVNRIEIPFSRNPSQFVEYKNSIDYDVEVEKQEKNNKKIKGSVYSELRIESDDKWNGVPVGAFLEWGTGPLGESTNNYPHGYNYTHHVWDYFTAEQFKTTGTYGIRAKPHFLPALNAIKGKYIENIKEAVKKAWMMSES